MQYLCSLVSASYRVPSIINVWISIRPISQPRRVSLPRPFPARTCIKNPPMQMPGIRSNIQSHFLFSVSTCCCENARTRALRYLYTGAVYPYLYMKQLCTRLVCRAVSRLNHAARFPIIPIGKRASIRCTSVRLSSPFAFGSGSLTLGTDLLTKFKLRLPACFH